MQVTMFDGAKPFKINKPIRLIELFAGIGSQAKALQRLGAEFEHWVVCEFDKYAIRSYNAIHGTDFDTSDITKIKGSDLKIADTDQYCYIMTYSFPCQDLSKAGKGAGMAKDSGTRSGLLWEVERLLKQTEQLPQVLLMENVPDVIGTKNIEHFAKWVEFLEKDLGYKCYWDRLNAKDYGIPQNRDRCFMVSVLGDYYYNFPKPKKLKERLKDRLDNDVDIKYYLTPQMIKFFTFNTIKQKENGNGFKFQPTDGDCIARSITTRAGGRMDDNFIKCEVVAILNLPGRLESACRVHGINGIALACNTVGGGGLETKILEPLVIDDTYGYDRVRVYNDCPTLRAGRQGLKIAEPLAYDEQTGEIVEIYSITVDEKEIGLLKVSDRWYAVRKLTPKECFRLMGFDDDNLEKAQAVNSNSQLYKQAGNSIVVDVLEAIFGQML